MIFFVRKPGPCALQTSGISPRGATAGAGWVTPARDPHQCHPLVNTPSPPPQSGAAGGMQEPEPMGDQWLSQREAQTQAPPGGTKATRGPILPLAGTRDSTSLQGQ